MFSKDHLLHMARSIYANLPLSYPIKSRIREALSPILQTLRSDKSGLALWAEFQKSVASRSGSAEWTGPGEQALAQLLKELAKHCNSHGPIGNIIALPFMSSGGAERVALNFARAFRELQPDSAVLIVIADRPLKNDRIALPKGLMVVVLDDYLPRGTNETQRLHFLKSLIQAVKPHIFHNINSETAWKLIINEGPLLSKITRIFASIFAFQYLPRTGRKTGYAAYFLQPALPHIHGLLSDNRRFIVDAIAEYNLDPASRAKLHLVYNPSRLSEGHDPNDVYNVARVQNDNSLHRRLQVLWAGRLDAEKRIDLLYDIARNCNFADFIVFGQRVVDDESEPPALPNLVFMGGFSDPREFVTERTFDAFIFTSRWEGLPNILLEVGLLEIPVVAPVVGGVGELISETTGYPLPEKASVQDYEHALKEIMAHPEAAVTRALSLKKLIQTRHSWDAFINGMKAVPGYVPTGQINERSHRPAPQTEDPTVSIIIPCYNQGRYLYESVSSALLA